MAKTVSFICAWNDSLSIMSQSTVFKQTDENIWILKREFDCCYDDDYGEDEDDDRNEKDEGL